MKENDFSNKHIFIKKHHWLIVSVFLILYDIASIFISYMAALFIRFDLHYKSIPQTYLNAFLVFIPFYIAVCIVIYYWRKLYQSIWRFASYVELVHMT